MKKRVVFGNTEHVVYDRAHLGFNALYNTSQNGDFSHNHRSLTHRYRAYADFAAISYKRDRPAVYLGHRLDRQLSDPRHAIYVRGRHVIFANRGTKDIHDVATDVNIIADHYDTTDRYKHSRTKMIATMRKYPRHAIDAISHSMGAYAQMHMTHYNPHIRKRIRRQYLYNPGASSTDVALQDYASDHKNNFYIKHGDPISADMILQTRPTNLKLLARNIHLRPSKNHTIHNFTTHFNSIPPPDKPVIKVDSSLDAIPVMVYGIRI